MCVLISGRASGRGADREAGPGRRSARRLHRAVPGVPGDDRVGDLGARHARRHGVHRVVAGDARGQLVGRARSDDAQRAFSSVHIYQYL